MGNNHAYGKLSYIDGGNYEGDWHHGRKEGHGIQTYANGDKYEGFYKDGKRHGPGIIQEKGKQYKVNYSMGSLVKEEEKKAENV